MKTELQIAKRWWNTLSDKEKETAMSDYEKFASFKKATGVQILAINRRVVREKEKGCPFDEPNAFNPS